MKDRVAQVAVKIVIEPLFEASFRPGSYSFQPKRSAKQAIFNIRKWVTFGYDKVIDLDLKSYFDTIDHELPVKLDRLNPILRGWSAYTGWLNAAQHFRKVDQYVTGKLRRWLQAKHQRRRRPCLRPLAAGGSVPGQLRYGNDRAAQHGTREFSDPERSALAPLTSPLESGEIRYLVAQCASTCHTLGISCCKLPGDASLGPCTHPPEACMTIYAIAPIVV